MQAFFFSPRRRQFLLVVVLAPQTTTAASFTDSGIRVAVNMWVTNRQGAMAAYGHIKDWDTSGVQNMKELFLNKANFNDDISKWDVSGVTTMYDMFYGAVAFNQPVGQWNVSSVKDMYGMFSDAAAFNGDLSQWDVSGVTTMRNMFYNAAAFNQDLGWCLASDVNTISFVTGTLCSSSNCGIYEDGECSPAPTSSPTTAGPSSSPTTAAPSTITPTTSSPTTSSPTSTPLPEKEDEDKDGEKIDWRVFIIYAFLGVLALIVIALLVLAFRGEDDPQKKKKRKRGNKVAAHSTILKNSMTQHMVSMMRGDAEVRRVASEKNVKYLEGAKNWIFPSETTTFKRVKLAFVRLENAMVQVGTWTGEEQDRVKALEAEIVAVLDEKVQEAEDIEEDLRRITASSNEMDSKIYQQAKHEADLAGRYAKWGGVDESMKAIEGLPAKQRTGDILELYEEACAVHGRFKKVLKRLYAKELAMMQDRKGSPALQLKVAAPKHLVRIIEKTALSPTAGGSYEGILDIVRASIICDNKVHMVDALGAVLECEDLIAVRGKNRWARPTAAGWADLMVNVRLADDPTEHVCEIQIIHKKLMAARKDLDGHKAYAAARGAAEILEKLEARQAC